MRTLLAAIVFAGALAACDGGSDEGGARDDGGRDDARTEAALEGAVRELFAGFLGDDPQAAYERLSNACQQEISLSDFVKQQALTVALLEGFAEIEAGDLKIGDIEISDFRNDSADVVLTIEPPDGLDDEFGAFEGDSDSMPWAYEDGTWRITDCEDFASDDLTLEDVDDDDDPEEQPSWAREISVDRAQKSGGVMLTVQRVLVGVPEDVESAAQFSDWDGAKAIIGFVVEVRNDNDFEVSLPSYFARAVVNGRQLEVDGFASDSTVDELLPNVRASMTLYVPVDDIEPDAVSEVALAIDGPSHAETFDSLGEDFLIEIVLPD